MSEAKGFMQQAEQAQTVNELLVQELQVLRSLPWIENLTVLGDSITFEVPEDRVAEAVQLLSVQGGQTSV